MCATKLAWRGHGVFATMFGVQKKVLGGGPAIFDWDV